MLKIKRKVQSIKDYFRERARVRRIKADARTLIELQMMEARVHSYILELEAKVDAQAKVIRFQYRELRDQKLAEIDREIDVKEAARWNRQHETVA